MQRMAYSATRKEVLEQRRAGQRARVSGIVPTRPVGHVERGQFIPRPDSGRKLARSKYTPHQGAREIARRHGQMAAWGRQPLRQFDKLGFTIRERG